MIQISKKNMTTAKQFVGKYTRGIRAYRRQCGAAMSEFLIAIPALLFLGLGAMQLALMYNAKTTVTYAAFEATRVGAVAHAQSGPMREEFGTRIAPIFGGDGSPELASAAIARGLLEANDSRYTRVEILSPTQEAFADFGVQNADGVTEIPNTHLRGRPRDVGSTSGVNIQDANLLKVKITYAYDLKVPLMDRLIPAIMRRLDPSNARYYTLGRIPVSAVSTVRMQSPARESDNASFNGGNSGGGALPPGDPGDGGTNPTDPPPGGGSSGGDDDTGGSTTDPTSPSCDPAVQECIGDGTGDDDGSGDDGNGGSDDEIQCETSWDDERYEFVSLSEADGFIESIRLAVSNGRAVYNIVHDFLTGLLQGLGDQVSDLVDLILNPGVIADIVSAAINDPEAFIGQIIDGLVDDVQRLANCGPGDIGRIVGQNVNPATVLRVVSRVADSARLARYADDLDARNNGNDNGNGNGNGNGNNGNNDTCITSSFVAGTPIFTPNGKIAIEYIERGSQVASRSDIDFSNHSQAVTSTISRIAPSYYHIVTETGEIQVTDEHPLWIQGEGWVKAKDVKMGSLVATHDGDVLVESISRVEKETKVYNFSVANTPSYFAGDDGLWVHNCQVAFLESNGRNTELNNPAPNTVYYVDGRNRYTTDADGRTIQVRGEINENTLGDGVRNCYRQGQAASCGLPDDDGGHLIATSLGGPGEIINLVPQNFRLNRWGRWREMERSWGEVAANGGRVQVDIELRYNDPAYPNRPTEFVVTETINGVPQTPRVFRNEAGG